MKGIKVYKHYQIDHNFVAGVFDKTAKWQGEEKISDRWSCWEAFV